MGKPQRRRGNTSRNKHLHKKHKTKRYTRDIDQVFEDQKPENITKFTELSEDEELPGMGQYYCVTCAKHFCDDKGLIAHKVTKFHKRMVKELKVEPHNHKSAELYAKY
jgi:bud site selection protein 20